MNTKMLTSDGIIPRHCLLKNESLTRHHIGVNEAVQSIITNLKMEIYLPGDYVVTHGSVGDTFFNWLTRVDAIF